MFVQLESFRDRFIRDKASVCMCVSVYSCGETSLQVVQ